MPGLFPHELPLINLEENVDKNDPWYIPRETALQRLRTWTGKDFGYDAAAWRAWLTRAELIPQRDHLGREVWPYSKSEISDVESCRTSADLLSMEALEFDDYADSVTPTMMSMNDKDLQTSVELVPADFLKQYAAYLRQPMDIVLDAAEFRFDDVSADLAEIKKRELRAKYERLCQLVRDRLSSIQ
ncbi:MAG TPA: hypothetical protein VK395_17725 [Gemmataceae bacterium]|nr:hypothetical protein [Gemmataceae bacterium]